MFQIDSNSEFGFLSMLIPEAYESEVRKNAVGTMQDAANSLQWSIYSGLTKTLKNSPIRIFNILPIGSFPQYYKKSYIKSNYFSTKASDTNINIGFCNLKLVRKYDQTRRIYRELSQWCHNSNIDQILIVYTINPTYIKAISKLKGKYPNLKICAIVADLPNMVSLSSNKSLLKQAYEKHASKIAYKHLGNIDCFVLLTKYMADYLKIKQPYCVIEGISTEIQEITLPRKSKHILYSGTLHKRFGIINLLNAFKKINDPEYRLYICGTGDSEKEILESSKEDPRIVYLGQIKRNDVLQLQQTMNAVINPRQNIEEFTKYSFPSKNLEYLSSGVPLIAYKLDGIPEDYDPFINYVENNSVEALQKCIQIVCEDTTGQFIEKARKGQLYVLNEKNDIKQVSKIIDLLRKIK